MSVTRKAPIWKILSYQSPHSYVQVRNERYNALSISSGLPDHLLWRIVDLSFQTEAAQEFEFIQSTSQRERVKKFVWQSYLKSIDDVHWTFAMQVLNAIDAGTIEESEINRIQRDWKLHFKCTKFSTIAKHNVVDFLRKKNQI